MFVSANVSSHEQIMHRATPSKKCADNYIFVKQEIDEDYKESLPTESSSHTPALKCEYDPDCGCAQCRFNANTNVKTEEHIKQEIKLELEDNENKVKIEAEFVGKCVKDVFENGECGCNECIGAVVESTQSHQKQPQISSSDQKQSEQPSSTEQIDNHDSSDYINDCPTPDYLPPFFSEDEEDEDGDEDSDENTEPESDIEYTYSDRSSEISNEEEDNGTEVIQKKERPFKCDHCKRSFLFRQVLRDHKAKVHQIGKCYQYKCKWYKCEYFSNDRCNAMRHISKQHFKKGNQRNPSEFLQQIESTKKSMIKPDRRKLIITLRLNCPKCPNHFPNKDKLNIHLLRSHQIELYRCVVRGCYASFKNKLRYHAHKNEVHKNVYAWQCDHCALEAITYVSLRGHTYFNHEEGHFRCAVPGCGFFSLTNRSEIKNHHQTNHIARKGESCNRTGLQIFCSQQSDWRSDCSGAEDEQNDEDNQSSRTVNISKRKYHEESSESDNDSDFEPTDDEKSEDEDTELEDNLEMPENTSGASKLKAQVVTLQMQSNKKFKSPHLNDQRRCENISDSEDSDKETEIDSETEFECTYKTAKKIVESRKLKSTHSSDFLTSEDSSNEDEVPKQKKVRGFEVRVLTLGLNCSECDATLKDIDELNLHLRDRHQIFLKRCLVRDCFASFESGSKLSRHYQTKHTDCKFDCGECDSEVLANHKQMFSHKWKLHQQGHFRCSFKDCHFESHSTRSVVINHYKANHYKCTIQCPFEGCGLTFPFQYLLNLHAQIHTKEKPFKCEHCEASYTTKDLLIKHLAQVHQIGKWFRHECKWPKCKFITNQRQNAYSHVRTVHFKRGDKRDARDFVSQVEFTGAKVTKPKPFTTITVLRLNCPEDDCSEHFSDKAKLNIHLSRSHQIEEYRCVVRGCLASFQNCLQYTAHKKEAHNKMKVWPCDQCDYEGNTYKLLTVHKCNIHEEGHFACGYPNCGFVSRTNRKVLKNHLQTKHSRKNK